MIVAIVDVEEAVEDPLPEVGGREASGGGEARNEVGLSLDGGGEDAFAGRAVRGLASLGARAGGGAATESCGQTHENQCTESMQASPPPLSGASWRDFRGS